MIKVYYYKPWAYYAKMHQVNPELVFDANDKPVFKKEEKKEAHPLDRLYQRKITNSMIEVPRD